MSRPTSPWKFSLRQLAGLVVAILFPGLSACAFVTSQASFHFQEGQLFDLQSGTTISFEELQPHLLAADVIYIGEEHYNPSHIQTAIRVLNGLLESGKHPALAMEMFSWDGQPALNRFINGQLAADQFLEESHWEKNWGGEYKNYQPLVALSKHRHFPLYALNPPRNLVRKVATMGLKDGLADPAMAQWGLPHDILLNDSDYRRVIFDQIVQCHPELPEKVYQRIYEASIFRDEGMAKSIVDFLQLKTQTEGPLVSYTGGGHIQYRVPIPNRVQRQTAESVRQVTVYLMAFDPTREEDIQQVLQDNIADYVWLTPLGPEGPQPRCGKAASKKKA